MFSKKLFNEKTIILQNIRYTKNCLKNQFQEKVLELSFARWYFEFDVLPEGLLPKSLSAVHSSSASGAAAVFIEVIIDQFFENPS